MKGKVVKMNNSTKEVEIEVRGKIEKHIVGKAIFNQKKFQEGDNIEYNLKGKNFEFLKKISGEEMGNKQNNFFNNRNNKNFSKNNNSKEPVKVKQYPYNFVSFKEEKDIIDKGKRKLGTNTGKLVCKLVNRTPLFVMGKSEQDNNNGHTKEWFYREKGIPAIPASSLKGAVRNVIDVLTNSVIRNVEDDRLEERKGAGKFESVFGIIESLPERGKNGIIVEAEKIRVKMKEKSDDRFKPYDYGKEFSKKYSESDGLIERVKLKDSIYKLEKTKIQIKNKVTVVEKLIRTSEEYKKFLTDDEDENGVQGVLWFSSPIHGKIYEKLLIPKKNGKKFEFSQEEYQDFEYIINQRKDRIKNGKEKGISSFYYDKGLEAGDPVLFQVENGERAEHLAFSEIPRLRYKFSPLDLVPKEFRPSDSLDNLSFSERLFGTIGDNTKKDEGKKEELVALSGRVFFEDAKNYNFKMIDDKNLIILKTFGEPHPTLTTFYLDNTDKDYNDNEGIHIRGRKFYWHHKDKIGTPFSKYRKSVEMPKDTKGKNKFAYNSSLELMDINNEFEFEVHFENLTDEELGVLIYALELEDGLLHKIGKGKAFGFGSCKIAIEKFLLETKEKYETFFGELYKKETDKDSKKEEYINKARAKKYFDENRTNIKELKKILSEINDLDFSESPFPEDINKKGEINTLNWFVNNKKGNRKIVLLSILDENPK